MTDVDLHIERPPPWGYFATLVWALLAAALCAATLGAVIMAWTVWQVGSPSLDFLDEFLDEPLWVGLAVAIASAVLVAVVALAARLRGWSAQEYLGLCWPAWRDLGIALVLLAVFSVMSNIILHLLDVTNPISLRDDYRDARAADVSWLFWINAVIIGPVSEEILTRGFLQRGWVRPQYGALPGIAAISTLWAALHFPYGWILCADIFVMGLLLGWARWRSGSTVTAILMHALYNLWQMLQIMARA
jgi:CAAX protease family protein